jgi:leucyl aminopeptidase (aminopeptidase T)
MSLDILMDGARRAVNQCMNVKKGERVLIITDNEVDPELSQALKKASEEAKAECLISVMRPLDFDGQEPPERITEIMKTANAVFLVTGKSLSHTRARRDASRTGVRIASMPSVTKYSFVSGGLTADYRQVKDLIDKISVKLKNTKIIRITSDNGTDFTTRITGRKWKEDDGLIDKRGKFCNLPAGEIAVAPVEGTTTGVIVIDKMSYYGEGIKYVVKNGLANKIEGSILLENTVNKVGLSGRNIAEIGIGTNPKASVIGNILEDEKVLGTIHVALGNNVSLGGNIDVPFHLDGIIIKPTVEVDGKILIKNGKWTFLEDSELQPIEFKEPVKKTAEKTSSPKKSSKGKSLSAADYDTSSKYDIKTPYNPYILREPLESHYFDPWIGGWTRLNNRFVINPQLYGYLIKVVEIHEKIHNIYKTGNEGFVEMMTQHIFRNKYFSLSGNYS